MHSLVPLRSVITEIYLRANIVARLRTQNDLGQKWFLLHQESLVCFSSSRKSLSCLVKIIKKFYLGKQSRRQVLEFGLAFRLSGRQVL